MTCHACHQESTTPLCPACSIFCEQARQGFLSSGESRGGRVLAVASAAIEEHCNDWPIYSIEQKDIFRPRFVAALEDILKIQEQVIRDYCHGRNLPLQCIDRELVESTSSRKLAQESLAFLGQGDHLVIFAHAGGVGLKSHPLMATLDLAAQAASQGTILHSAALGLDLGNPLGQYALRLAQDALAKWSANQTLDRYAGGKGEDEEGLFGLSAKLARWDARVRWVVEGIRSGLSPYEMSLSSKGLYVALKRLKVRGTMFCLAVMKSRTEAYETLRGANFLCVNCGLTAQLKAPCFRCERGTSHLSGGACLGGAKFHEFPDVDVDRQILACWDFHRRINPGQDEARPWEKRKVSA